MDERHLAEAAPRPPLLEELTCRVSERQRFLDAQPTVGAARLPVWVVAACLGAGVLTAAGCQGSKREADIPKPPTGLETALVKPDAALKDPALMEPELESEDPMDPVPGQMDPPSGSMQPLPPPTRGADDPGAQEPFALTGPAAGRPEQWKVPPSPSGTYGAPFLRTQPIGSQPKIVGPNLKSLTGNLDPNEVRAVIRAHRNEVRHCYSKGLLEDPALEGELRVSFQIDAAGLAKNCKVEQHLKSQVVGGSVCTRLTTWRFPIPDKPPAAVTVAWTLSPPDPADTAPR